MKEKVSSTIRVVGENFSKDKPDRRTIGKNVYNALAVAAFFDPTNDFLAFANFVCVVAVYE